MTLPPVNSSSDEPTGIGASLTKKDVPLFAALPPPDVVDTSSTSVVTGDVCMFVSMSPITTVVVLPGTVYIVYGEPALFGSAANVTTLNVFAISFSFYIIILGFALFVK
jgi:hypothetical protein